MRTIYRIELAYRGEAFAGFRWQPDRDTVERHVRDTIAHCGGPERCRLGVAGLTDRGVHARRQVVSFSTRRAVDLSRLERALARPHASPRAPTGIAELDAILQGYDCRCTSAGIAPAGFHASFSASARHYLYRVRTAHAADTFNALLRPLVGRRCFRAYGRKLKRAARTHKHMSAAYAVRDGEAMAVHVVASGFLRRQVRVLVATLLREADAGAAHDTLLRLAESGDPRRTAPPAPPGGLVLWQVNYPSLTTAGASGDRPNG
ncbi:MAG: hypothetical protein AAGA56_16075 [Myxococcota bacterium]